MILINRIHIISFFLTFWGETWWHSWQVLWDLPKHDAVAYLNLLSFFIWTHRPMAFVFEKATLVTDALSVLTAVQFQHLLMERAELRRAGGQRGIQSGLGRRSSWGSHRIRRGQRFWTLRDRWVRAVLTTQPQLLQSFHKHVASGQDGPWFEMLSALRTFIGPFLCCLIPVLLDTEQAVTVSTGKGSRVLKDVQAYGASKRIRSPVSRSHDVEER